MARRTGAQRGNGRQNRQQQNGGNDGNSNKLEKLGALWIGKSANGVGYMSGEIEGVGRVVVFKNGYKQEDKHPDYVVYLSQDRDTGSSQRNDKQTGDDEPPFGP